MKKNLSVAYGRFPGFTYEKLSMQRLKRNLTFCREVLEFVTILEPGISTQKALTLYELWQGEIEMAGRLRAEDQISQEELVTANRKALAYLEEAAAILKYEPENSIHGQLGQEVDIKLTTEKLKLSKL